MRQISIVAIVFAAIAASYGLGRFQRRSQPGEGGGPRVLYYVDPMHPAYKSDKPGVAPDCGMRLTPVFASGTTSASPSDMHLTAGTVSIDGATQRLLGIRTEAVQRSATTRVIEVVGRAAPEDTRVYSINAGVDGFIRETYQDSVGVLVKKDQKLASYYSPDFLAVASGFLAANERVPGAAGNDGNRTLPFPGALSKQGTSSIQGYADRLRNLGMSDVQIEHIAESRQLPENIDVVAPADGFILSRSISAGQHFEHHMEFYRIADLSRIWVVAEVYDQDAAYWKPGTIAQVSLKSASRKLTARVADSLPKSEPGGGTVKIRLEVENPGFLLRPDMLVDIEMPVRLPAAVTVPLDAVVDSGSRSRVYVERGEGVFEPREVETGWRAGERVEVLSGVQPGERVVAAATFLVNSESRLATPALNPSMERAAQRPSHAPASFAAAKTAGAVSMRSE